MGAESRGKEVVSLLLKAGANVNARFERDETSLHWAAHHGNVDAAQLLINHGADVNLEEQYGTATASSDLDDDTIDARIIVGQNWFE